VQVHVEDHSQVWDLEIPGWQVGHSADVQAAVEGLLGPGGYRCEVMRKRAPERKAWSRDKAGFEVA
jgi:hypothetical protein